MNESAQTIVAIIVFMLLAGILGFSQFFLLRRALKKIKSKDGSPLIQYFGVISSVIVLIAVILFFGVGIYFIITNL